MMKTLRQFRTPLTLALLLTLPATPALAQNYGYSAPQIQTTQAQATQAQQNQYLGPNITRTYSSADLSSSYGLLDIGKDELWMISFPDSVTDVLTTREGVIDTRMMGNSVAIAAVLTSGQLPVAIKLANGNTAYFLVRLSPSRGGGIKNIVVTDSGAAQPVPNVQASVSPQQASQGGGRYTVTPQPQVQPYQAPAQTYQPVAAQPVPAQTQAYPQVTYQQVQQAAPAPASYALPAQSQMPMLSSAQASGGVSTQAATYGGVVTQGTQGYPGTQAQQSYPGGFPTQAAQGQSVPNQAAPSGWVSQGQPQQVRPQAAQPNLQAQFALQLDGSTVVLYYRLSNPGQATYTLNDQAIQVTSAGQTVPVTGRGAVTLLPGASTYGTVTLPAGTLRVSNMATVSWSATQAGTGAVTTLQGTVAVQQASMPNWRALPLAQSQGGQVTALAWR